MIGLVVVLIIIGVLLWLVETKIPMDDGIKVIIRVVVLILVVLYLLRVFGVLDVPVPRIR